MLLAMGDLPEVCSASGLCLLHAGQQGFDLKLLGPTLDDKRGVPGQTASVVKADGPIKSVADLKGKRIGVNTINSVNWMYDRAFLRKHGLDPSQVTYVEIPFPSMIDALARGSVDAAVAQAPVLVDRP